MKVRLHAQARHDLVEIRDYLRDCYGREAAERVRRHLKQRIDRLGTLPLLGVASGEPGLMILSPSTYPYRIYFTRTAEVVVVLHIRHTSRQLPDLKHLA